MSIVGLAGCGAGDAVEAAGGKGSSQGGSSFGGLSEAGASGSPDPRFNASYFPLSPVGSTWIYDVSDGSGVSIGSQTLSIVNASGSTATFNTRDPQGVSSNVDYSLKAGGLVQTLTLWAVNKSFPVELRLFAIPGSTKRSVSGAMKSDVNSDGRDDTLSYDFNQILVGYDDDARLPSGTVHYTNEVTYKLELSNRSGPSSTSGNRTVEDIWLAPALGPVAMERRVYNLAGNPVETAKFRLISAQVGANHLP